jgi:type I restriction enzyme M protein
VKQGATSRRRADSAADKPSRRTKSANGGETTNGIGKSLETWIWDAACSIRGAKDASKYKDFILPLIFTKRLCDVFDDEINRIAAEVGTRAKAFKLVTRDKQLVRFYLPLEPVDPEQPVWTVIRSLSAKIGETLTTYMREIADANPLLKGIVDRVDFNATTHGQRDLDDDRLSNLIEAISAKRLGLEDVEPDIIGRSYEYLIRKFAEDSGQSAGEFYTPAEVGFTMAKIMDPSPGMTVYDPCCGSAGLLIKCQLIVEERHPAGDGKDAPLRLFGQEHEPGTWAMANMNMIIHDMEGEIQIGDTFRKPQFLRGNRLQTFDRVVANPMWNQSGFKEKDYDADELGRFPKGAGFPGGNADWGWLQHILASLNDAGRAAVVLDTGAASRGSGTDRNDKEKSVRQWFIEQDYIEAVVQLPENLFYNTPAAGMILFLSKRKPENKRDHIFMVNAGGEYLPGRNKNRLSPTGIDHIAQAVSNWAEETGFARVVTRTDVADQDFTLLPTRYVVEVTNVTHRPVEELVNELEALQQRAAESNDQLIRSLRELRSQDG